MLMLLFVGCSSERPTNQVLLKAEQMVDKHPQRAMSLIYDTTAVKLRGEDDRAFHQLLYVTALHKSGVYLDTREDMEACEMYFDRVGDRVRLAKAKLQYGNMLMHCFDLKQAVGKMKGAEDLAENINDATLHFDLNMALGELNKMSNCGSLMVRHYKRAVEWAEECAYDEWKAMALYKLGQAYRQMGEKDSVRYCAEKCVDLLHRVGRENKAALLTLMGIRWLQDGENLKAKGCFRNALKIFPNEYAVMLLGDICQKEGNIAKAVELWYEATNTNDNHVLIETFEKLTRYYEASHEYWRAFNMSERGNRVYRKLNNEVQTVEIARLQTEHEQGRHRKIFYRRLLAFGGGVVFLALSILIFWLYHRKRMRGYLQVIRELNSRFDAEETDKKQAMLSAETVYRMHRKAASGKSADDEDWQEIYRLMEKNASGFIAELNRRGIGGEKEMNVCIFIKLRFLPSEIAVLMDCSPQSITNIRQRLLLKLFGENGGTKEFDRRIREM